MPAKAVLSETDKEKIRQRLREMCEQCWMEQGYKKTSVKALCSETGISIGTFYTLYPTKEDLFLETVVKIQQQLLPRFLEISKKNPSKEGFAESMKDLFREYDRKPILYNVNTPDFQAFMTKLSEETMKQIKFDNIEVFKTTVKAAKLKLKVEEGKAYGIFNALLATISAKETLSHTCDYFETFDYMVDHLVQDIFE